MRSSIVAACALVAVALPNAACATEWSVDTAKSWLGFTGIMAKAPFNGRFGHWRADISFDPAQPEAGHAVVKVDMSSAATGDRQK